MPAQIVLVHDDAAFADAVSGALRESGFEVMVFPDPLVALDAIGAASRMELLITRAHFSAGLSNGQALALMGRDKRPGLKVLFVCRPENAKYVEDLGHVVTAPAAVSHVVSAAARLIGVAATERIAAECRRRKRDNLGPTHRTDEQLEVVLHETGHWIVNGRRGSVLCSRMSLNQALESAVAYEILGTTVTSVCRSPEDDIVLFPDQIRRVRKAMAGRGLAPSH